MPILNIKGIGKVKVKGRLPKFKKMIKIGNKRFKADIEAQKLIFARDNLARNERKRLSKKFGIPFKRK